MRNDTLLYTGLTSKTGQKLKEEREAKTKERLTEKAHLTPAADLVIEALEKEKQLTQSSLLSTIDAKSTDEDTKTIIVSLNLYGESMDRLKNRIKRIMRVPVEIDDEA